MKKSIELGEHPYDVLDREWKLEADVKNEIKVHLESVGAYQFWPVQMGFGARTIDCFACYRGRFLAIETKRPKGGKLTTKQRNTLRDVQWAGGKVMVATSVDPVCFWIGEIDAEICRMGDHNSGYSHDDREANVPDAHRR